MNKSALKQKKVHDITPLASIEESSRLNEKLENLLQFEQLVSSLSAHIVTAAEDALDDEIDRSLSRILDFLHVDRCGLLRLMPDEASWVIEYAAYADGIPTVPERTLLPVAMNPWIYRKFVDQHDYSIVQFASLDDLPPEAETDKQTYRMMEVKSGLLIPLIHKKTHLYMIAVNAVRREMAWPPEYIARIRLFGEILVSAVVRRDALQAERTAAEHYRSIIAAAPDAIMVAGDDGSIVFVSPKALTMFGYEEAGEVVGRKVSEWLDPQDHDRAHAKIMAVMTGQNTELAEFCLVRKDGTRFVGEVSASCILDTDGVPSGFMVFIRDVSSRKQMEHQLLDRITEIERLKKLLEDENAYLMLEAVTDGTTGIVGQSDAIKYILFRRKQIELSDTTGLSP